MNKRIISLLVCLCLLLCTAVPVLAEETEETLETTLVITDVEDFLKFAESCRLDSYSFGLHVSLEADLDLTDTGFNGIPIFSGIFEGNGHRITGLNLEGNGSIQGLFRYLTGSAVVQNLSVHGSLNPEGSRNEIGAIAGSNAGQILNCSFSGTVSGSENIGGLVGVNTVTGLIENCNTDGVVHGDHFVGGIAGKNNGVIRGCTNRAEVNTTVQQNSVEISDITMDTLTNSEAVNTVTDIGGICGTSSGVIRDCVNHANVGYQHMGYNIGGIAGTQSGYMLDCANHGQILGRKEVGGIVGQMEPAALISYEEDALQILEAQLESLSSIANQTSANVRTASSQLNSQVGVLQGQIQDAKDAVNALVIDPEDPQLPDLDAIQAAQNNLSSSLSGMTETIKGMGSTTQSTMGTLTNNLYALQSQISAMGATLGNVSDTLGGNIQDVSDLDTELDLTGKVEGCINDGDVLADLNAGGIAGAMALENDLDLEDDWQIEGSSSLNFESELRAVILNCENSGTVTAKKQNAGGIVGWQSIGLVKNSMNSGKLDAESADYVGGISGQSTGFIRSCSAKTEIAGDTYVGGIAGSATVATDCRSMVKLNSAAEKFGAVLGYAEEDTGDTEDPIARNVYMIAGADTGGIDGISYEGAAYALSQEEFLALEEIHDLFSTVSVTFVFENGAQKTVALAPGDALRDAQIPEIPEKDGYMSIWDGLSDADLSNVFFDMTFEAIYTGHNATIQTEQKRENGLPILLAQGDFTLDAMVSVAESNETPVLSDGETLLEVWNVTLSEAEKTLAVRLQVPENCDTDHLLALISDGDGNWTETEYQVDGKYLVIAWTNAASVALVQVGEAPLLPLLVVGVVLVAAIAVGVLICRKKRMHKKQKAENQ